METGSYQSEVLPTPFRSLLPCVPIEYCEESLSTYATEGHNN